MRVYLSYKIISKTSNTVDESENCIHLGTENKEVKPGAERPEVGSR